MKIIAHRGAVSQFTENTLPAIRRALELSFDGVEFDVRRTGDGEIVLMHDATINRTTTGQGRVSALTMPDLSAVRTLDGATVPTLNEVMNHVKNSRKIINIEIKSHGCAEAVATFAKWPNVYISSPIRPEISRLQRLVPKGRYGLVINNPVALLISAREAGLTFLTLHKSLVNARVVRYLYKRRLRAWVFTVKNPAEAARLQQLAIAAVFTDVELQ